jgi:hypothetical protein
MAWELGWELLGMCGLLLFLLVFVRCRRDCWMREPEDGEEEAEDEH